MNRLRPDLASRVKRAIEDMRIELVCLCGYHGDFSTTATAEAHEKAIRKEIEWASVLECPRLRVMGGAYASFWSGAKSQRECERITAEHLRDLGVYAAKLGVTLVIETHAGTMAETASTAKRLMELVDSPSVGLIYDQDQIEKNEGEEPEEAVKLLAPWIRHVHLTPFKFERRGVPGRVARVMEALGRASYDGYLSVEYPRHTSAPVPPAEEAMPRDLGILRALLER